MKVRMISLEGDRDPQEILDAFKQMRYVGETNHMRGSIFGRYLAMHCYGDRIMKESWEVQGKFRSLGIEHRSWSGERTVI